MPTARRPDPAALMTRACRATCLAYGLAASRRARRIEGSGPGGRRCPGRGRCRRCWRAGLSAFTPRKAAKARRCSSLARHPRRRRRDGSSRSRSGPSSNPKQYLRARGRKFDARVDHHVQAGRSRASATCPALFPQPRGEGAGMSSGPTSCSTERRDRPSGHQRFGLGPGGRKVAANATWARRPRARQAHSRRLDRRAARGGQRAASQRQLAASASPSSQPQGR